MLNFILFNFNIIIRNKNVPNGPAFTTQKLHSLNTIMHSLGKDFFFIRFFC